MDLRKYIATVPDFPQQGILFRDITPLLNDGKAYAFTVKQLAKYAKEFGAEVIIGPEARGFIFGSSVAYNLELGFVPIRKPEKLPREVIEIAYELEYGSNKLSIHKDAVKKGQKVVIIDDLLATGGTIAAAIKLVESLGGIVVGTVFLMELKDLNGREKIGNYPIYSLIEY
ncbi:adenine phosphoribosyltransferase [Fusobacterium sp. PH5-44]|uniref:adenine phosphoribosyltransferase n=1 Tax=unclassified Fusobacterium TaxID=2648384 RepID=UPI003D224081